MFLLTCKWHSEDFFQSKHYADTKIQPLGYDNGQSSLITW